MQLFSQARLVIPASQISVYRRTLFKTKTWTFFASTAVVVVVVVVAPALVLALVVVVFCLLLLLMLLLLLLVLLPLLLFILLSSFFCTHRRTHTARKYLCSSVWHCPLREQFALGCCQASCDSVCLKEG